MVDMLLLASINFGFRVLVSILPFGFLLLDLWTVLKSSLVYSMIFGVAYWRQSCLTRCRGNLEKGILESWHPLKIVLK